MELLTDRLNAMLTSVGTHSTQEERSACADRLRHLIIAYGKAQAVSAIQLEHKVFQSLGLAVVDADALTQLDTRMKNLASSCGDALADEDLQWMKAGAPEPQSYMTVADPATVDSEGPEFTINDPDLDALLNYTAVLLGGHANMDVGLAWADSLDVVLKRLAATVEDEVEDVFDLQFVRYRVHSIVDKVLGRGHFVMLRSNGVPLMDAFPKPLPGELLKLRTALAAEFEHALDHVTTINHMTLKELVQFIINNRPNNRGSGSEKEKATD